MFCDNESVCAQYNAELDIYGESDLTGADPDLWALLYALKREVGACFKLTWQRSHPERRRMAAIRRALPSVRRYCHEHS